MTKTLQKVEPRYQFHLGNFYKPVFQGWKGKQDVYEILFRRKDNEEWRPTNQWYLWDGKEIEVVRDIMPMLTAWEGTMA